jgi:hypothetical protein
LFLFFALSFVDAAAGGGGVHNRGSVALGAAVYLIPYKPGHRNQFNETLQVGRVQQAAIGDLLGVDRIHLLS